MIFFKNNLGNLNIDWIIGVKKKLWSVLLGVIMALWLCIKMSVGGMHAEVFVHKFAQCLQFDLKCSTFPLTHPQKMWRQDRWNKYGKIWWLLKVAGELMRVLYEFGNLHTPSFCLYVGEWCRPERWSSSELGARGRTGALRERFVKGMLPSTSFLLACLFPSRGVSTSHIPSGVQYSKSSPMGAAGVLCGEGRWLQKSAARLQRSVGNARLPVWLDFVL